MSDQKPTIGRVVHYTLTDTDAQAIEGYRHANPLANVGNPVAEGQTYPAVVVRAFGGPAANLQVLLDGTDAYWATSRTEGEGPGTWAWPVRA